MGYGRKFIQDLPDLKLSLWGGDVELNQLKLRTDAIERIFPGCGIYIKSGILHHLSLHIPWTSLTSSPICIRLENLELEAVAITTNELPDWVKKALFSSVDDVQGIIGSKSTANVSSKSTTTDSKEESGWGAWMIRKISNNITLEV